MGLLGPATRSKPTKNLLLDHPLSQTHRGNSMFSTLGDADTVSSVQESPVAADAVDACARLDGADIRPSRKSLPCLPIRCVVSSSRKRSCFLFNTSKTKESTRSRKSPNSRKSRKSRVQSESGWLAGWLGGHLPPLWVDLGRRSTDSCQVFGHHFVARRPSDVSDGFLIELSCSSFETLPFLCRLAEELAIKTFSAGTAAQHVLGKGLTSAYLGLHTVEDTEDKEARQRRLDCRKKLLIMKSGNAESEAETGGRPVIQQEDLQVSRMLSYRK